MAMHRVDRALGARYSERTSGETRQVINLEDSDVIRAILKRLDRLEVRMADAENLIGSGGSDPHRPAPTSIDTAGLSALEARMVALETRPVVAAKPPAAPSPEAMSRFVQPIEARLQALETRPPPEVAKIDTPSWAAFETALAGLQAVAERVAALEGQMAEIDTPPTSPDVGAQAADAVRELAQVHQEAFARYEAALGQHGATVDELRQRIDTIDGILRALGASAAKSKGARS